MLKEFTARNIERNAEEALRDIFKDIIQSNDIADALFIDSRFDRVIGVAGLPGKAPAMLEILKNGEMASYIYDLVAGGAALLLYISRNEDCIRIFIKEKSRAQEVKPNSKILETLYTILANVNGWAGVLNDEGEHEIDLLTPSPGPHFYINLLVGNRIGYSHALQTTPKSVVDRYGGGSFRSHAATQVLATRWDMRQEENGHPANRQFYLAEGSKKIFYSADVKNDNILYAKCIHSPNYTTIRYITRCGLIITRLIFILPQIEGLPIATEVQRIEIQNTGKRERKLKLVYTGMFGSAAPGALFEDVLYSNIIMQSRLLGNEDGTVTAIGPDYYPEPAREDQRFHSMMVNNGKKVVFANEFCMNYNEFVGNGTLQEPEGLMKLSNNLSRKGPGFFALACEIELEAGGRCFADNFTGLVSGKVSSCFNKDNFKEELSNLVEMFSKRGELERAFEKNREFLSSYSLFMQAKTSDQQFNTYFNKNLPFQVLYQTFVSRSFCQTQKGYRELGFREIQDLYASMHYFSSMGMNDFIKQLLREWCSMVFEFGYAYHNFFWVGKEPGKWSDDALWLIQAVYRYINLSGDIKFLDDECIIAGTEGLKKRTVFETIKAIIRYSAQISVGKHGLPLLDYADWNDCLKLDTNFVDGITKEKMYEEQIAKGKPFGEPLDSDYSESVMNAFLLKTAINQTLLMSKEKGDFEYAEKLADIGQRLYRNIQQHAWKEDFFARVLFNRYKSGEYSYLGAKGDKLSANPELDGTYFLNSFSWSILAEVASEKQIDTMLDVMEKTLKTPFGLKLVTLADLEKVSKNTAAGEYFPGDRENGGVFKHACMMATAAMFKAAKEVEDEKLALRLSRLAYWIIDLVLPYRTMKNPFGICGNPRFCTQYNNSETGENIGPMLSGTSTWLTLTLISAFGIEFTRQGLIIDPILRENEQNAVFTLRIGGSAYTIKISKPEGFYRVKKGNFKISLDGVILDSNLMVLSDDNLVHTVEVHFNKLI